MPIIGGGRGRIRVAKKNKKKQWNLPFSQALHLNRFTKKKTCIHYMKNMTVETENLIIAVQIHR